MTGDCLRVSVVHADSPTIYLNGELDASGAEMVRDALAVVADPVTINMCELTFIDSVGLGAIVQAIRAGRAITLRGAEGAVAHVLDITGIDYV